MVSRGTLIRDAAEVDAALILCGLKSVMSTPVKPRVVFTQRETVLLLTGLYGLPKLINKFVTLPQRGFVSDKYSRTVKTGLRFLSGTVCILEAERRVNKVMVSTF